MTQKLRLCGSIVLLAVLGIVALSHLTAFASANAFSASNTAPQFLGERTFNSWFYQAYEEGDGFVALYPDMLEYSEAGTNDYIRENHVMANRLFTQYATIEGLVRFRIPTPLESLPITLLNAQDQVKEYYLQYSAENGDVVTIGGAPTKDEFLPKDELEYWEGVATANSGKGTTQGFTRIVMTLSPAEYDLLRKDSKVWFIDVTAEYAVRDAFSERFTDSEERITVSYPFPYPPADITAQ